MPSNAFCNHLLSLLEDAEKVDDAVQVLSGLSTWAPAASDALNRSGIVLCVSAWEGYIEELVREAIAALKPPSPPLGFWPVLNATVLAAIGRFNTPNVDQVRMLISDALGLQDIPSHWLWPGVTANDARAKLQDAMNLRHAIAHGVNPRPLIHVNIATQLREFVVKISECTDGAVRDHLVNVLGVGNPWPP